MEIISSLSTQENLAGNVLTIGNFDGVHLGHKELLRRLKSQSQDRGLRTSLLTFYPHPIQVLYPERKIERMFDRNDLREVASQFGIDYLIEQEFDQSFSQIGAVDFLERYVCKKLKAQFLVVGYDFSFGRGREGGLAFMTEFCEKNKLGLEVVAPVQVAGITVSSSKIRNELKLGDLRAAKSYLGRNYYLRGLVEKGFQRGRTIGVPTANIRPQTNFVPRLGVYASRIHFKGQSHFGITNIGVNPTVSEDRILKVETHLFAFSGDIYDFEIKVELLEFIRDEKKFENIEDLKQQINLDIQKVRNTKYE